MRAVGIALVSLIVGAGALGGYLLAERNTPVSKRAMEAYRAGHYAEAVPLLKTWAQSLTVKKDGPLMGDVLTYLADAELRAKGGAPSVMQASLALPSSGAVSTVAVPPVGTNTGPTDPSTGKGRVPHATPAVGQTQVMAIKELGNFEFDPTADTDIPADVKALNGTKVKLRGFMIPLTQAETITDFALVPSLVGCCFGQPPGVQHTITCSTLKGKSVPYTVDEISAEGTLRIKVQRDQGYAYSIFELDVTSVKPVE